MYLRKSQIEAQQRRSDKIALIAGVALLASSIWLVAEFTAPQETFVYQIRYFVDGREHTLLTFGESQADASAKARAGLPAAEIVGLELLGEWDGMR